MALLTSLAACAASDPSVPAGHQPNEETAVLEAMDRYMTAISANDLEAMAGMQTVEPDACTELRPAGASGVRPAD
jgi:hypothetical protein